MAKGRHFIKLTDRRICRIFHHAAWPLALILIVSEACKTPQSNQSEILDLANTNDPNLGGFGFPLESFTYEIDPTVLKEVGSRLGCQEAARWMAYPKSGSMRQGIRTVINDRYVYRSLLHEFLNRRAIMAACVAGGTPPKKDTDAGIKALHRFVKSQNPNNGVTIVMLGGFGSHIGNSSSLDAEVKIWERISDDLPDDSLQVWQIECSNSFAPDKRCAREFVKIVAERERTLPRQTHHRYLLWGFGKGGNTAIEALKQSRSLRNKTLAVVTNGTPIGGSMAISMLNPLVQELAQRVSGTTGPLTDFAKRSPIAYLLTPSAYLLDRDSSAGRIAELLTPEESAQLARGTAELLPSHRQRYIQQVLRNADFSRDAGGAIPVFFAAAITDISRMRPWPRMTVERGDIAFDTQTLNTDHLIELGFSPMLQDYPLSDTIVALEHAVIPKQHVPKGLKTEMIALYSFDHATFRYSPLAYSHWDVPHLAIVDATLDAIAQKLAGGGT